MGELIQLREHRADRGLRPAPPPSTAFFFDVSCPLSYLAAEHVERQLGEVEWVAVDGTAIRDRAHTHATLRARAEIRARALRLPLVWPDTFPARTPCALRAAAYACEIGAGPAFALAAGRLAFCGGFDLEDPEALTEAAAAAGVPLEACLEAARETWRDEELAATAAILRERGVVELPVTVAEGRWFAGDASLLNAASTRPASRRHRGRLAPVG